MNQKNVKDFVLDKKKRRLYVLQQDKVQYFGLDGEGKAFSLEIDPGIMSPVRSLYMDNRSRLYLITSEYIYRLDETGSVSKKLAVSLKHSSLFAVGSRGDIPFSD